MIIFVYNVSIFHNHALATDRSPRKTLYAGICVLESNSVLLYMLLRFFTVMVNQSIVTSD